MLVPIREEDGFVLDIRYATADNPAQRALYTRPAALVLPPAYALLMRANARARALGLRLRIFDAFRPVEAQWALWHAIPDKRFVADPRQGGLHPRGAAVDLTLEDAASGESLPMGTGFDAMTESSAHDSIDVAAEAQRNRALLLGLMTAAGWGNYRLEWWHYHLLDAKRHPPLCAAAVAGGPM
ncbi:MAG: D-alanyl-D-alanine dipeptidase [Acetobacteraceae bacterium]|nr:D-alanyl-D-alanine dipeptidase [Acetobacteraceae bacterium]